MEKPSFLGDTHRSKRLIVIFQVSSVIIQVTPKPNNESQTSGTSGSPRPTKQTRFVERGHRIYCFQAQNKLGFNITAQIIPTKTPITKH